MQIPQKLHTCFFVKLLWNGMSQQGKTHISGKRRPRAFQRSTALYAPMCF